MINDYKPKKAIEYASQDINEDDIKAVIKILKSDFLTQGPTIGKFENAIKNYVKVKYSYATSSASSGLHIACIALDLGPGDILWTSPNSFVASANCAIHCGAKVDFVDIDPKTYNMCVNQLEEKLIEARKKNKLPKIVMPVHFAGQSCEMRKIRELSHDFGFSVIEDASHAVGGEYIDQKIGNCKFSDISVFSFHPVKILATGEGGMVLTNKKSLADKMRVLRSHGITSDKSEMYERPKNEKWNYQQIILGFNYRMTDMQAALGISQLSRIDQFLSKRRKIAAIYDEELKNLELLTPFQNKNTQSSYHLYPILITPENTKTNQIQFYKKMWERNIFVNIHYIPIYLQPFFKDLGFEPGYCPNSENYFKSVITLPLHYSLSNVDHEYIINSIKEILL